jgi:hypothetical protein
MTMEINSESSNGIIGLDGVYLYSAFLSGRQLIWSAGNPEGIFGRHSLQSLKHPLEYIRAMFHPKERTILRKLSPKTSLCSPASQKRWGWCEKMSQLDC